jgi:hypothetical protein
MHLKYLNHIESIDEQLKNKHGKYSRFNTGTFHKFKHQTVTSLVLKIWSII